jgi:hypothetical protein
MKDPNELIWKINIGFQTIDPFKSKFTRSRASVLLEVMNLIAEDVIAVSTQRVMALR